MATSNTSKSPDASVPLNMRIKPATRNLIDRAAELLGKTRTDFMLEASERRAEEVLLDRSVFTVSPEVYAEYLARLDAPAQTNERLKRTMSTKAPWDEA
ncbi:MULTISPECIES: type II toxin-antitoxin system TacA family antitoxin [unclassified Ensifer]|uniref:type II toxin-antitoxin system TacA family antitoxin n=1 Tax=unclassified Ensifer TaxID=2633371 RepID=UPI00300F9447